MSINCKACRAPIPAKAIALSCISCSGVFHIKCVNITKNQYDTLISVPGCIWKCTGCTEKESDDRVNQITNEELIKAIENLQTTVNMLQEDIKALKNEKKKDNEICGAEMIINEIAERQKRDRNIIVYKMEESNDDVSKVTDIIKRIAPKVETTNLKAFRLGRSQTNKFRPLKVQLSSREDVFSILKNKAKLRELNINVIISTDQTKMQQDYYRKIKSELDGRKDNGEENIYIKYINGIPTIVKSKNA